MIKLCRLDDRMIHGQIVTKWSRVISVDRIIVANDHAGENSIVAKSLLMAAPGNIKVAVKTVKDAIELLHQPKAREHDILLIVANPKDLLTMVEQVEGIDRINIGNWGLLEASDGKKRESISQFVALSEDEKEILAKVCEKVDDFVLQVTPDVSATKVSSILKIKKGD